MNSVLESLNRWIEKKRLWWNDDPRDFLLRFLDGKTQLLPSELSEIGRTWHDASSDDSEEAEKLVRVMLEAIPPRAAGELAYVLTFFGEDTTHLTLLGPTVFPDPDSLRLFTEEVKELSRKFSAVDVELGAESELRPGKLVHALNSSEAIEVIHRELLAKAKIYNGRLLEKEFSGDSYFPHVTHEEGCGLHEGDKLRVNSLVVSLHPGARINVPHAYNLGKFALRG